MDWIVINPSSNVICSLNYQIIRPVVFELNFNSIIMMLTALLYKRVWNVLSVA